MKKILIPFYLLSILLLISGCQNRTANSSTHTLTNTLVSIRGENFYINNEITLKGASYNGVSMEGLLPNSRMVQGIFDDLNSETKHLWKYPDTGEWDAQRNTNEFVAAMPEWRKHGLLAISVSINKKILKQ